MSGWQLGGRTAAQAWGDGSELEPEQQAAFRARAQAIEPPELVDVNKYPDVRDIPAFQQGTPDFAAAAARRIVQQPEGDFPPPEDVGRAEPSALSDVEYVEDIIRPGRIMVVAAEEGAGKSFAIAGELGVRVALAGGTFAETWPVLRNERVLVLSEMHADDDLARLDTVCASLGLARTDLAGHYWRLSLATAAAGAPPLAVDAWREFIVAWARTRGIRLLIIDTATGATDAQPWGAEIQRVYRQLRAMLADYPELAVVLLVRLKKPQGHGERRLSDVLGEWGRWNDITLLMEAEGLERVKLTARKRVRVERRIVVTKRGGLLVEPRDVEGSGPKVAAETVVDAVAAQPGLSLAGLAAALGVSRDTARNYVKALADRLEARPDGRRGALHVYLTSEPPNTSEQAPFGGPSAVVSELDRNDLRTSEPPYIGRRSDSGVGPASAYEVES